MAASQYLAISGKQIHFKVSGKGKAVVLLHGFLGSIEVWKSFEKKLSEDYKVILIDLPGHGKSETLGKVQRMNDMANVVHEVLRKLGVKKCLLAGHSMGGYIGLSFAELYPEMLYGLCLFNSTADPDSQTKKRDRLRTVNVVEKNHKIFIETAIPGLFNPVNIKKLQKEMGKAKSIAYQVDKDSINACLRGMRLRKDGKKILQGLNFPVLYMIGKQDPVILLDKVLAQLSIPKHCESLILDDCGHMGFYEKPKETLTGLAHFVIKCT